MSLPTPSDDWALFLDFDGTLVNLADAPDAIVVDPSLPEVLRRLRAGLDGALAIISGRPIEQIDRYLHDAVPVVAGQHGMERRDGQGVLHHDPVPEHALAAARVLLAPFIARHPGLLLEDKGASLVLHYRQAPELAAECERQARNIATNSGGELTVQDGKMIFEIKSDGQHKGDAVAYFMQEPPFQGRTPVFAGDDVTDEAGFAIVNRMGGISIRVGDGAASAARYRAPGVAGLFAWLKAFPDA